MWSRRELRVKAVQHFFAYSIRQEHFQSSTEQEQARHQLLEGLQQEYALLEDAYCKIMRLLVDLGAAAEMVESGAPQRKKRHWGDLRPIQLLKADHAWKGELIALRGFWPERLVKEVYYSVLCNLPIYQSYQEGEDVQKIQDELQLIKKVLKKVILNKGVVGDFFSATNIYWLSHFLAVRKHAIAACNQAAHNTVVPVDRSFIDQPIMDKEKQTQALRFYRELVDTARINYAAYTGWIKEAVETGWAWERLTFIDVVLIVMGLAELSLKRPDRPVEVVIHEYLEISKIYSTPKSFQFINGVLDQLRKKKLQSG